MRKILNIFLFLILFLNSANAVNLTSFLKKSDYEDKSTISVFVKNKKNNHVVYKKNEKKLLNPASTLKVVTFGASYKVLGKNYLFETIVYKDTKNNLYIKLGGDPLLSYLDLVKLFSEVKGKIDPYKINGIFIDDSIFDKTPYPDTWMQEDIWPNQRAITPYIVDNNLTEVLIKRSSLATKVDIIQTDNYKIPVINELKLAQEQKYTITREYGENSPIVTFRGDIKEDEVLKLPVLNPQINFVVKLNKALSKNNFLYDRKIQFAKTPANVTRLASYSHGIEEVSKNILFDSDNFTSEVVSKVAASKYIGKSHPATNSDMIKMFYDVYSNIITGEIKIVDSCGVSRKNLLSVEFLVSAFNYICQNTDIQKLLATSNQGTLKNRLLFLKDNLKAKTGTLSNMSAITGSLTSKKSNELIFAIIIQNSPKRSAVLKNFEDEIITLIYRKY